MPCYVLIYGQLKLANQYLSEKSSKSIPTDSTNLKQIKNEVNTGYQTKHEVHYKVDIQLNSQQIKGRISVK